MGCDIHMITEVRRTVNGEKKWVNADHWKLNPYFSEEDSEEPEYTIIDLCGDRNYELFSALANVRNYNGNPCIFEPRGIPADASAQTKKVVEYWGSDGHSHSYVTLAELRDFASKHKKVKRGGMVSPEQAQALDCNGVEPKSWCLMTSDKTALRRDWESDFTCCDELIAKMEERLREVFWLYGEYDSEKENDIRIVFFFDN